MPLYLTLATFPADPTPATAMTLNVEYPQQLVGGRNSHANDVYQRFPNSQTSTNKSSGHRYQGSIPADGYRVVGGPLLSCFRTINSSYDNLRFCSTKHNETCSILSEPNKHAHAKKIPNSAKRPLASFRCPWRVWSKSLSGWLARSFGSSSPGLAMMKRCLSCWAALKKNTKGSVEC